MSRQLLLTVLTLTTVASAPVRGQSGAAVDDGSHVEGGEAERAPSGGSGADDDDKLEEEGSLEAEPAPPPPAEDPANLDAGRRDPPAGGGGYDDVYEGDRGYRDDDRGYRDDDRGYRDDDRGYRDDRRRGRDDRRGGRDAPEDAPAARSGGGVDNNRLLVGGLMTTVTLRLFPIFLLDYLVAPFVGAWAVEQWAAAPIPYQTSSKLLAALAMFGFDVVAFSAVAAVSLVFAYLGALAAPALGSICFWSSFLLLGLIPLIGVGFVGMWVMELLDGDAEVAAAPAREPARRRRRRRQAVLELPAPASATVASAMPF